MDIGHGLLLIQRYTTSCKTYSIVLKILYDIGPYITWNGAEVSGPMLIYHDEFSSTSQTDEGALICRHDTAARVAWFLTNNDPISDTGQFLVTQERTGTGVIPSMSRLVQRFSTTAVRRDEQFNGLWSCGYSTSPKVYIGIYARGEL